MLAYRALSLSLSVALALSCSRVLAQDADTGASSPPPQMTPAQGNPLGGLFTPQPQFPTPESHPNPDPKLPAGADPTQAVGKIFDVQPQYPDPQNPGYAVPKQTDMQNPLNGLFTGQPQYPTPESRSNPEPKPKDYTPPMPVVNSAKPPQSTDSPTVSKSADTKSDDKNGKGDDKNKTASAKDKDKDKEKSASKDKDKDKETADKDKDKDSDKETADKDDKDKDKDKEKADSDEDKEAKQRALAKKVGAYTPVKEAVFLMQTGQYNQALDTIQKYLKSTPKDAQAHYIAAVVEVALRQYKSAAGEYNQVVSLAAPGSKLSGLAMEGLKKIGFPVKLPAVNLPPLQQAAARKR